MTLASPMPPSLRVAAPAIPGCDVAMNGVASCQHSITEDCSSDESVRVVILRIAGSSKSLVGKGDAAWKRRGGSENSFARGTGEGANRRSGTRQMRS